jgi:hypothetical protein
MGRSNSAFHGVAGHGDNLDFDKHVSNGSLRIAIPPKGNAYIESKGQRIPVLPHPDLFSYVTPENSEAKDWEEGSSRHYDLARSSFTSTQKRKDFKDKLGQIKRSCPVCKAISK